MKNLLISLGLASVCQPLQVSSSNQLIDNFNTCPVKIKTEMTKDGEQILAQGWQNNKPSYKQFKWTTEFKSTDDIEALVEGRLDESYLVFLYHPDCPFSEAYSWEFARLAYQYNHHFKDLNFATINFSNLFDKIHKTNNWYLERFNKGSSKLPNKADIYWPPTIEFLSTVQGFPDIVLFRN